MLLIVSTGAFKRDRKKINPLVNENQIMRMDIDGDNTGSGNNGGSGSTTATSRKTTNDENGSEDSTERSGSTNSDVYLRQERPIGVFGDTPASDQSSNVKKGLTTVMNRRPV